MLFAFITLWICLPALTLGECLTKDQYKNILARWVSVFTKLDKEVARHTMTRDIKYWSDSNDFISGQAPGSLTGIPYWANRSALIAGVEFNQAQAKTSVKNSHFTVLQSSFGCKHITFHWRNDGISKGGIPGSTNEKGDAVGFGGIDYLFIDNNARPKRVETAYSEFNAGELLFTSGYKICFQKNNDTACS